MARRRAGLGEEAIQELLAEASDSDDDLGEYDWDLDEEDADGVIIQELIFNQDGAMAEPRSVIYGTAERCTGLGTVECTILPLKCIQVREL